MFPLPSKAQQALKDEYITVMPDLSSSTFTFFISLDNELLTLSIVISSSSSTTNTNTITKDQIIDRIPLQGCKGPITHCISKPSPTTRNSTKLVLTTEDCTVIALKIEELSLSFLSKTTIPNLIHVSFCNDENTVTTINTHGVVGFHRFDDFAGIVVVADVDFDDVDVDPNTKNTTNLRLQNSEDPFLLFEDATTATTAKILLLLENADVLLFDTKTLSLEGPLLQFPEPQVWETSAKKKIFHCCNNNNNISYSYGGGGGAIVAITGSHRQYMRVDYYRHSNDELFLIEGLLLKPLKPKECVIGVIVSGAVIITNWRVIRIIMEEEDGSTKKGGNLYNTSYEVIYCSPKQAITCFVENVDNDFDNNYFCAEIILSTGAKISLASFCDGFSNTESYRNFCGQRKKSQMITLPSLLMDNEYVKCTPPPSLSASVNGRIDGEFPSALSENVFEKSISVSQSIINQLCDLKSKTSYLRETIQVLHCVAQSLSEWVTTTTLAADNRSVASASASASKIFLAEIDAIIKKNDSLLQRAKEMHQVMPLMDCSVKMKLMRVEHQLKEMITEKDWSNKEGLEDLFNRLKVDLNK